jgi:CRISPR-associated protein Cas2
MRHEKEYINGRKLMWMMVMFDLPTETRAERKSATKFRQFLLDEGFEMIQFSVYVQFTGTFESSQKFVRTIKKNNPQYGDINILFFTDKQFANIIHIENRVDKSLKEEPKQFELF